MGVHYFFDCTLDEIALFLTGSHCIQMIPRESADEKAAFSFVVKRLKTARCMFPVSSLASHEGLSKTILWSDLPNVSRMTGVS